MSITYTPTSQINFAVVNQVDIVEPNKIINSLDTVGNIRLVFDPSRPINRVYARQEFLQANLEKMGILDYDYFHLKNILLNSPSIEGTLKSSIENATSTEEIVQVLTHSKAMLSGRLQIVSI